MIYTVSGAATIQTVIARDQVSATCGIPNSCGALTYLISDAPASGVAALTAIELTISSAGVISASSTNTATSGAHTVSVSVKLASYTSVTILTTTFTLTIICVVTSLSVVEQTTLTALSAQAYSIPTLTAFSYLLQAI